MRDVGPSLHLDDLILLLLLLIVTIIEVFMPIVTKHNEGKDDHLDKDIDANTSANIAEHLP